MTRTETALEKSVYSPLNHLTRLLDRQYFTDFSVQSPLKIFPDYKFLYVYLFKNLYFTVIMTVNVPISRRSPGSQHAAQLLTNPHPGVDNFPKFAKPHKVDTCTVVQILFWVPPTVLLLPPRSSVRPLIPGKCRISSRHFACKIPPEWGR